MATVIRSFHDEDEAAVVGVWHRSGRAAYGFLPTWHGLTLERARQVFWDKIRARSDVWVGTRLIDFAKSRSPEGLELHTHLENHAARALYERHGFIAVKFGMSPPPESSPDVEYHWRPR